MGRNGLKEKENISCDLFTLLAVYGQEMHLRHLLTFCNFDELQTKDIGWKSFPIKFEKSFPSIKKESRKLQFSFFLYTCLQPCTASSRGTFRLFLLLICSEQLNKDLSLLSEPPPFNFEWQHLLLHIFSF